MKFSNPFSRRPTEELVVHTTTFLGVQDGPPERILKGKLSELFAGYNNLLKAYLARVHHGATKGESVCLCLSVSTGEDKLLVDGIGSLFASFGPSSVRVNTETVYSGRREAGVVMASTGNLIGYWAREFNSFSLSAEALHVLA